MIWIVFLAAVFALLFYTALLKLPRMQSDLRDEAMKAFSSIGLGIVKTFPNAVIKHRQDVNLAWSGKKLVVLNSAFRTSRAETVHQLEETLKYVQSQFDLLNTNKYSGIFVFEASSLLENDISREAIVKVCSKYGFESEFVDTMARHGGTFEKIDVGALEVKKVEIAEQIAQSRALFFPDDDTDWTGSVDYYKSLYSYVGYVEGKAVTTATAHVYESKVFLFNVGTHPDYRNRGYGTTISKYALQMAMEQSGSTISLLHASAMGKPIYEKIGFKQIGTVAFTAYKPSEEV
jgi:ribosomal protein S18 acetylase RimI-like enzyme